MTHEDSYNARDENTHFTFRWVVVTFSCSRGNSHFANNYAEKITLRFSKKSISS